MTTEIPFDVGSLILTRAVSGDANAAQLKRAAANPRALLSACQTHQAGTSFIPPLLESDESLYKYYLKAETIKCALPHALGHAIHTQ